MEQYVVEVELIGRARAKLSAEDIVEALTDWHVAVSRAHATGGFLVTLTLPAEGLRQAVVQGLALVAELGDAVSVSAIPERVRDARAGWDAVEDLVSVSEAAEVLGVSRQRVLQMIAEGKLPRQKVGRGYAIPRAALNK